jgi:hypothetical protein
MATDKPDRWIVAKREAGLAVGALAGYAPGPCVSFVVKAAFSFRETDTAKLEAEPRPLSEGEPGGDGAGELGYPCDFVARKAAVDVLLRGHAYGLGSSSRIDSCLKVGDLERRFCARASAPCPRIPLRAPYLFETDGSTPTSVGAKATDWPAHPRSHREDFDWAAYQIAPLAQRSRLIRPGSALTLEGLSASGPRQLELPTLVPRLCAGLSFDQHAEVPMVCDTLWLDTDRDECVLVWRGFMRTSSIAAPEIERIVVQMDPWDSPCDYDDMLRDHPRYRFELASVPGALGPEPRDDDERERLVMARYESLGQDEPPEPELDLDHYARISAELAEKREPRAEVLGRHELDEHRWFLVERAWLERMAERALVGDGTVAASYGEKFQAEQLRLARPEELQRGIADYAELSVLLERSEDPERLMRERSLSLSDWMRLDQRMSLRAKQDPATARAIEQARAELEARLDAAAEHGAAATGSTNKEES